MTQWTHVAQRKCAWRECQEEPLSMCRCSVILSPVKCPVILSPCRNGEDNHVGTTRAEANVGTEPGPEWEVGGARSRRDFRAESAADPSIAPGLPETRGQSPGPWESG